MSSVDGSPVDLEAIEARWDTLMSVDASGHAPSSYMVVKFDVPALVAVLRELRLLTAQIGLSQDADEEYERTDTLVAAVLRLTGPAS